MAKVRVFELARELNIPGKDLIQRLKDLGYPIKGNFDALSEDQIVQIKAKMLEPVTRVEAVLSSEEEPESGEQPRKRRIISARRSEEVHKIQKSLGISGPLPEDERTREEVEPRLAEEPPPPAEEVAAEGSEPEAAPPAAEGDSPPLPEAAQEEEAAPAAEAVASVAPGAAVAAAGKTAEDKPDLSGMGPAAARAMRMKQESADAIARGEPDPAKIREQQRLDAKRAEEAPATDEKGKWRDFKRADRKPATFQAESWTRGPRRRPHHRRPARPRVSVSSKSSKPAPMRRRQIRLGQTMTVSELAGSIGIKANEIIAKLMALGVMATINQTIDGATAELVAGEFGIEVNADTTTLEDLLTEEEAHPDDLISRPPIVTVMGHVDHGKTSLLDKIRKSDIASGEAGGITQHIGAYFVHSNAGDIVFLDTPGHEAFTSLRARGADVTDVVVLVVAADDGVMPQTVEAIEHSQAAEVPIIVAINKTDRPNADPERVKTQLMEYNLLSEDLGGETIYVHVSAMTGDGIDHLLEMLHLQAEVLELKAVASGQARGYVIESEMDSRRGPVATVIVQRGLLKVGDDFVAGTTYGRVRAMFNDRGEDIDEALPATPVVILGYNELPKAGDVFVVMNDDKTARQIAESRSSKRKEEESVQKRRAHLEDFLEGIEMGEQVILNIVLKTDTQGSLEAIRLSLEKLGSPNVRVEFVRAGVGGITETDISLAATTDSIVIGFNVRADAKAQELGHGEGIDIKLYTIIYELIDDVKAGLQGMLKPIIRDQVIGHFEVREVFSSPKDGQIVGGFVTDGRLQRNSFVRLFRDDVLIHNGTIGSLRRFKDDVPDVQNGYECGLRVANYHNIREGDLIEAFVKVEEAQTLESIAQSQ